ncbi:MAG: hypothetical protein AAFQ74_20655, partial [Cyanobacteria bacterium J06623_4]
MQDFIKIDVLSSATLGKSFGNALDESGILLQDDFSQIGQNRDQSLPIEQPNNFLVDGEIASLPLVLDELSAQTAVTDLGLPASLAQLATSDNGGDTGATPSEDSLLAGGLIQQSEVSAALQPAWTQAIAQLETFLESVSSEQTASQLQETLGDRWTSDAVKQALMPIIEGSANLQVELLPASVLPAKGAFAATNQTIYLSDDWASTQSASEIVDVLLEELGHYVDYQLGLQADPFTGEFLPGSDTPGDEGAIFSSIVQGKPLDPDTLSALQAEDDSGQILIGQELVSVELASLDQAALDDAVGTFVADDSGKVEVDFLFDGGFYAGELGIFSLEGMGGLNQRKFAKEAAKRALSGTDQGHIVISDKADGAQFSGLLEGRDFNK